MAPRGVVAALAACLALGASGVAAASASLASLRFDAAAAKDRPVAKVITLLKDMQTQLEKEAKQDEEIYDKLACWCETNDREKFKSIADAEAHIKALTTKIEELAALSSRLGTEIDTLEKEVAKNQQSLEQATALRQKQLAAFTAEEQDLLGSIGALKSAVAVLSKHHGGAFLQVPRSHVMGVAATLQHELQHHSSLLEGVLTHSERSAVSAFVQSPYESYNPQSGEIFGVLRQMQETFEGNLDAAQKDEQASQQAYEGLKAAKESEIAAGKAQIDSKTQELADTNEKLAHAKEDLDDTRSSLSADQEFLLKLKEKCSITDKEWEERQKTRQLEVQAVSKALAILSGDDAHDLFTRTFNPALLQRQSAAHTERREAASTLLSTVAQKFSSPQLATLAVRVRLDAFERVKKAIDDMVSQLLKEKADEIKHKDFCVDEFNTNQLQTEKADRQKQDLTAKIEDLEDTIKSLTNAIDTLKAEIRELQVQLKRAGENREEANKDFQATVADQRSTQKLLEAALSVLGEFYGQQAALVQRQPAGPPPPPGFSEYKANAGSSSVMSLLQQIISDAKAAEAEALKSEEDSLKAYEDFVKETNSVIDAKSNEIVNKSEDRAKTEADLVATKESKEATLAELERLSAYNSQLHTSCDFVLKNFELRQAARDEEVEALKQAKAILSGAKFEAFLQR